MKRKLPRLRVLFVLQFLITLLIPFFLHLGIQAIQHQEPLPPIFLICNIANFILQPLLNRSIAAQMDEYATAALQKAESKCYHIAVVWIILCCIPTLLNEGNGGYLTVYLLTCCLPIFMLIRAVLFWLYDSHGME